MRYLPVRLQKKGRGASPRRKLKRRYILITPYVLLGAIILIILFSTVVKKSSQKQSVPIPSAVSGTIPYVIEIKPTAPQKGDIIGVDVRGISPEELSYQWIVNDIEIAGANSRTFSEPVNKGARLKVRITFKGKAESYISKEVIVKNTPPEILSAKLSPNGPKKGDTIKVTVDAPDRDGDSVSFKYEWFKNGEPITGKDADTLDDVVFSRGDKISVSIKPFDGEEYGRTINVYEVIANSPPVIKEGKSSLDNGVYTLTLNGHDPDGDTLTYSLKQAPKGIEINPSTGMITWRPRPEDAGVHNILVSAADGHGGEVQAGFSISIK
ncbi:MAG: putative Ig domain-containing protein [Nitrospirae bacterium]|nr:putative Ig domain-containing protein [Nitrospirota bacterium]